MRSPALQCYTGRMRLQYAVVCHEFQDGQWEGVTNLYGVRHKLFASYNPEVVSRAEALSDSPKPPLALKLVISLIDGPPGAHRVWASVRRPSGGVSSPAPPIEIDWDQESPTFFVIVDVGLEVHENGTYEFNILVDGTPVGTVPLPVEVIPAPV